VERCGPHVAISPVMLRSSDAALGAGLQAECVPKLEGGLLTLIGCYGVLLLLLWVFTLYSPDRADLGVKLDNGRAVEHEQALEEEESEPAWRAILLCSVLSAFISVCCELVPAVKVFTQGSLPLRVNSSSESLLFTLELLPAVLKAVGMVLVIIPQYGLAVWGLLWTLLCCRYIRIPAVDALSNPCCSPSAAAAL